MKFHIFPPDLLRNVNLDTRYAIQNLYMAQKFQIWTLREGAQVFTRLNMHSRNATFILIHGPEIPHSGPFSRNLNLDSWNPTLNIIHGPTKPELDFCKWNHKLYTWPKKSRFEHPTSKKPELIFWKCNEIPYTWPLTIMIFSHELYKTWT